MRAPCPDHENESYTGVQLWVLDREAFPDFLERNDLRYNFASEEVYMDDFIKKTAMECDNRQHRFD